MSPVAMTTLQAQSLLHNIENHDLHAVNQLLQSGIINLDERDDDNWTALLNAAKDGHVEVSNVLLGNGANIDHRDIDGQTFLMVACQIGDVEIVRELLGHHAVDINAVDNDNWTALLNAAKDGHVEVSNVLLGNGANIDHRDIGGWTALMWSCYKGHVQLVKLLTTKGANPNIKGEHHMSCLTWAAGRGHGDIVDILLNHGSKVNTADKYGTTPLIWAARKGFKSIVERLLTEGANVDNAGMNSWTALIVAAKGGYTEVVQSLLDHSPNVNAVDKDGFTALTWAAKEGHKDIVYLLLPTGVYVNLPDRFGDTVLIHAVKGGHLEVVRALLKKYADIDVQGVDNKTALYWSVEKNHPNVGARLLECKASCEIASKDQDTPLLKAVKSRNLDMVRLLLEHGARVSAADKRGDTSVHIAVRGRSKRITELLLRNPKDGRLLYRPNKDGDTAYQIDSSHQKSVLSQVFGARNLNASDGLQGYDMYSSTIAQVLSEPALHTPITVGLYAKWGSGKSFLIDKLVKEMINFTAYGAAPMFSFTWLQLLVTVLVCCLLGVVLGLTLSWVIGLAVGGGLFILQYTSLFVIQYGCSRRRWKWAIFTSRYLADKLRALTLLLKVVFCNQPNRPGRETDAIRFLFTDNARLASVVGEKSITAMIGTLCDALEDEYGTVVTRLYRVFVPGKATEHGYFKTLCCIPTFVLVLAVLLCIIAGVTLVALFGINSLTEIKYRAVNGVLIAMTVIVAVAVLSNAYTWARMLVNLVIPAKRRVQKIAANIDTLKMEGFMQALKKEVELISHMTLSMDSFQSAHTRLVVIVDGLDSCEQEKLLQVLDTVHMLFGDKGSPFITILAVDPHVIIKGIESNLQGLFRDSSITGHDYLRNIVHLPFFLQSQTLPKQRRHLTAQSSLGGFAKKEETSASSGSLASVPDTSKGKRQSTGGSNKSRSPGRDSGLTRYPSQFDLSKTLGKNSYFSDINPRNMRRLMNIIAVTSRLLRAHQIEFSWYKLAAWINITEQWPYRLSWIILEVEDFEDLEDKMPLKAVYQRVLPKLPTSKEVDPLLEIDRDARKLEMMLASQTPLLTIADLKLFLHCTINVDPYLRKLIRELQQNAENLNCEYNMYGGGTSIFGQPSDMPPLPITYPSRRPSRVDASPRATPTRCYSMPRANLAPSYPAAMVPAHTHQHHQAMAQLTPYHTSSLPVFTRPPSRVNIQGGLAMYKLSRLTVPDVCTLLERLEDIMQSRVPQYVRQIMENNINGVVLLNCDLPDLKQVMNMTFGDWEILRAMIQTLRDQELTSDKDSCEDLADHGQSPQVKFTQSYSPFDMSFQSNKPSQDAPIRVRPMNNLRPVQSASAVHPGMHRNNSFMNEVLLEAQVLRGMVEVASNSEDEHEDELIAIPEEKASLRNSVPNSMVNSMTGSLNSAVSFSHSIPLVPADEDDDDDSDSEQITIMARKVRQKITPPKSHLTPKVILSKEAGSGDLARPVAEKTPIHSTSTLNDTLDAEDDVPLLQTITSTKKEDSVMSSGAGNTVAESSFITDLEAVESDATSEVMDLTGLISGSTSQEHLMLRRLASTSSSGTGPSAFKAVTPSSSRPSSRGSSLALSNVSGWMMSRESSVEAIRRLSISENPARATGSRSSVSDATVPSDYKQETVVVLTPEGQPVVSSSTEQKLVDIV